MLSKMQQKLAVFFPPLAPQKPVKKVPKRHPYLPKDVPLPIQNQVQISDITSIEIDLSLMPKINFRSKPHHKEYAAVVDQLVEQAFECISPYFNFLIGLDGIKSNEYLQQEIAHIIKRFIRHLWDLPASENHHHSEKWGLLVHSLDVACRQAERFVGEDIYHDFGQGIDSERTRKDKLWQVFAGFIVGMFHDAHKVYDMNILSAGNPPSRFELFRDGSSSLLEFNLSHPEGLRPMTWRKRNKAVKTAYNQMFALLYVPPSIKWKKMPQDLFGKAMTYLASYEELPADKDSVKAWAESSPFYELAVEEMATWYLEKPEDFRQNKKDTFHRLDTNWYACDSHAFIALLGQRMKHRAEDLIKALKQAGLMAQSEKNNRWYAKLTLNIRGEKSIKEICFIRTELFDKAFDRLNHKGHNGAACSIHFSGKPEVDRIFAETTPALADFAFHTDPEKEDDKKKGGAKKKGTKQNSKNKDEPQQGNLLSGAMPAAKRQAKPKNVTKKPEDTETLNVLEEAMPSEPEQSESKAQEQSDTSDSAVENQKEASLAESDADQKETQTQAETHEVSEEVDTISTTPDDAEEVIDEETGEVQSADESEDEIIEEGHEVEQPSLLAQAMPKAATEKKQPFYLTNTTVTLEQAQDLFIGFLEKQGRNTKHIQKQEGGYIFLSAGNELFFHYPITFNMMLDIPAGNVPEEAKVLRSKLMQRLEDLGYLVAQDGAHFADKRFSAHIDCGDTVDEFWPTGKFSMFDHEMVFPLSMEFGQVLHGLFETNKVAEFVDDEDAEV